MSFSFTSYTSKSFIILKELIPESEIPDTHGDDYASKSPSRILQTEART